MPAFHRDYTDRSVHAVIGIVFLTVAAPMFSFFGLGVIFDGNPFFLVFAAIGLFLSVLWVRGIWSLISPNIYDIDVDETTIAWGQRGKQKSIPLADLRRIHWDDSDGLSIHFIKKDGGRVCPHAIFAAGSRPEAFRRYMEDHHPEIPINADWSADSPFTAKSAPAAAGARRLPDGGESLR